MAKSAGPVIPEGMTLDADREWITVTCSNCGHKAFVTNGEGNVVSEEQMVDATLPDGSTVPIMVNVDVPSPTLRWVCGECGTVQEHVL